LQINNIDEINLNLDELDGEEITFGDPELEEFDIKTKPKGQNSGKQTSSETKKDNTKYIFFNE
jgi:hypothetical protein